MTGLDEADRAKLVKLYNRRDKLARNGKELPEALVKNIARLENKAAQAAAQASIAQTTDTQAETAPSTQTTADETVVAVG